MKARTATKKPAAKPRAKRNPPVTLASLYAEFQAMRKCMFTSDELNAALATSREHTAVSASHVRRLLAEKATLQAVIDDQRAQIARLKGKAPETGGEVVWPRRDATTETQLRDGDGVSLR